MIASPHRPEVGLFGPNSLTWRIDRELAVPRVWWLPPPVAFLMRQTTIWLLPQPLRSGFGYTWGPRRESTMQRIAAGSRALVPRLPRLIRDLPMARAAYGRVAWQDLDHARRRSGSTRGLERTAPSGH